MQDRNSVRVAWLGVLLLTLSGAALAQYKVTNLVSNQVKQARHTDPFMVNGWGFTYAPGSPFWVSDNGSGWSTLYDAQGNRKSLIVEIASAGDARAIAAAIRRAAGGPGGAKIRRPARQRQQSRKIVPHPAHRHYSGPRIGGRSR